MPKRGDFEAYKNGRTPTENPPAFPIVNANREIVGWTTKVPEIREGRLVHPEAERLVGELAALYVQIQDVAAARRAGAPGYFWRGQWICLALCSEEILRIDPASAITGISRGAGAPEGGLEDLSREI